MNEIKLTRGDSIHLEVCIRDQDGNVYVSSIDDKLVFTLKKSTSSCEIILQKNIKNNFIHLNHEETKELTYGTYKYDVQLTQVNGDVCTVIKPSNFVVTEEVNFD